MNPRTSGKAGFSKIDLLVVVGCACLLTVVAASASGGSNSVSKRLRCLANLRQLTLAWQLYANDHNGALVGNYHGGDAQGGAVANNRGASPWALGWQDWGTSRDNTNVAFILNEKYARLAPYIKGNRSLFKCPEDSYVSKTQKDRGWKERIRSYSMNSTIGNGNQAAGPFNPIYKVALTLSEITNPARIFTLADEHPDSMNDPLIWLPDLNRYIDLPGNLHHGAGAFGFADGHGEIHQWRGAIRQVPVKLSQYTGVNEKANAPDIRWMAEGGMLRKSISP